MPLSRHTFSGRGRALGRNRSPIAAPYLEDVDPELSEELQQLLAAQGHAALAHAALDLRLIEPCQCNDPTCASFYTLSRFQAAWLWNRGGQTLTLRTEPTLSVDVIGDRIVAVEVLQRPKLRNALHSQPQDRQER